MGVELEGSVADVFADQFDQGTGPVGSQHPADVFETKTVGFHGGGRTGFARVVLVRVARRDGINQVDHRLHSEGFQLSDFILELVVIVPRVGESGESDAVMNDALDDQARNAGRRQTKTAAEAAVVAKAGIFYFPLAVT